MVEVDCWLACCGKKEIGERRAFAGRADDATMSLAVHGLQPLEHAGFSACSDSGKASGAERGVNLCWIGRDVSGGSGGLD